MNHHSNDPEEVMNSVMHILSGDTTALDAVKDEAFLEGVKSVLLIRCVKHRGAPQLNTKEATGAECPICAIEDTQRPLIESEPWGKDLKELKAIAAAQQPLIQGLHRLYALRDPTCQRQAEIAYETALRSLAKVKEDL